MSTTETPARKPRSIATPSQSLRIRDCMSKAPHAIGYDQPLRVAHRFMHEHGLRHLPVLRGGRLVGLLSQRDLYLVETMGGVDLDVERVEEAMTQDVYSVPPDALLSDVVEEMVERRYGSVVVCEADRVVGIFTTTDALALLSTCLHRWPERVSAPGPKRRPRRPRAATPAAG